MDKAELRVATRKLEDNHQIGLEIRDLLELGPGGKQARDGQVNQAVAEVGQKWGRTLEIERARKLVEFAKKYTQPQLRKLIAESEQHGYCPEFGVIIRLLPLALRRRNKLQRQAIVGRWKKNRLNQEIARQLPADQLVDPIRGGRRPKAIESIAALTGEALLDARKWGRILGFLEDGQEEGAVWSQLPAGQQQKLKQIAKLLAQLGKGNS